MLEKQFDGLTFRIIKGDITKVNTDAIVNAANRFLVAGGGVDGAIHKAAGPELQLSLNFYTNIYKNTMAGEAVITKSFNLEKSGIKHIIHCVGPIYNQSKNPAQELERCYENAVCFCWEYEIESISFPSISTGVYGYPLDEAAPIAINTVIKHAENNGAKACQFVLFDDVTYEAYKKVLNSI